MSILCRGAKAAGFAMLAGTSYAIYVVKDAIDRTENVEEEMAERNKRLEERMNNQILALIEKQEKQRNSIHLKGRIIEAPPLPTDSASPKNPTLQ